MKRARHRGGEDAGQCGKAGLGRRALLGGALGASVLGALPLGQVACALRSPVAAPSDGRRLFASIAVEGSYRQMGLAMGRALRPHIAAVLLAQPSFQRCCAAAREPARAELESFEQATRQSFPHLMDELEGMAEGCGVDRSDLFAWNCRSEIGALEDRCPAGCSTVGVVAAERMVLGHNEDGHAAYGGRMVVVHARPPSGIAFASLLYPGTLAGNGPSLNARGVGQTTNYIAPCRAAAGVPRYFIGRAVLEAESLEHAVSLATTAGRAFPWHHNLTSLPDARLVSLETWPGRHHRRDVQGVLLHTNHLVHPEMQGLPEDTAYLDRSSLPRLRALERVRRTRPLRTAADVLAALADRSGAPCKVCRRPGDEVPGITVATALFASPRLEMQLFDGPSCGGPAQIVRP